MPPRHRPNSRGGCGVSTQTTIAMTRRIDVWDGFRFAWGVTLFAAMLVLCNAFNDYLWPRDFDDSDAAPMRSGLRIKTDNLTGCQYFVTIAGSITPRVNRDGKQICK
jgi:hypothetical protein